MRPPHHGEARTARLQAGGAGRTRPPPRQGSGRPEYVEGQERPGRGGGRGPGQSPGRGRPAVFLDRDGTLIEDAGFLDSIDRVIFYPWTIDTIRALNRAGLATVVVTNQSGVARKYFTEAFVDETHRHMSARFEAGAARIDAYYYCPHHPDGKIVPYASDCDCRKPRRGLIDRAARDLGLDVSRSFVVGDKWSDIDLARTVGARGILVRCGTGAAELRRRPDLTADAVVDNLAAAASWILGNLQSAT